MLVSVENLTVKYRLSDGSNFNALKDLSLEINRGQIVGIVGESGAGKSTIMSLIPRFYDSQSGKILIDGQNIYDVNLFSLRKLLSKTSRLSLSICLRIRTAF